MLLHCDGCDITADPADAKWLTLGRRGGLISLFERVEPDPLLGRGLTFHSYDCLRLWLMHTAEVSK